MRNKMAHGFAIAVFIKVRFDFRSVEAKLTFQEAHKRCVRRFHCGQQFDAIAGRNDHAFANTWHRSQSACRVRQIFARDRDPLAQRDRRGFMVHPNKRQCHWGPNL